MTQNLLYDPSETLVSPVSAVFRSDKYLPVLFCFFLLVTLHHFSEWFQVVEITQTESTLAVFLYMIQVCHHGFSPSGCFHCSFSCIPLEGLCAYYCLRRTYAYLPVASWCLFHFPDNWWIWNTRRFCNSVFFTRSLKVYSCILFFLFLVYFKNLQLIFWLPTFPYTALSNIISLRHLFPWKFVLSKSKARMYW